MAIIFVAFLVWDAVLAVGGAKDQLDLSWEYFKTDVLGAIGTFLCLVASFWSTLWLAPLSITVLLLFVGVAASRQWSFFKELSRRARNRESQR